MHTIYRISVGVVIVEASCFALLARADEPTQALSGRIQATIVQNPLDSTWSVVTNGAFKGDGASVNALNLYGFDASGTPVDSLLILNGSQFPNINSFSLHIPISKPDPDWTEIRVDMLLTDGQGSSTEVMSDLFPVIWRESVLMDHAVGGSVVAAPNYGPSLVPPGIGIPHALINSIPEGDYYAVLFFQGLHGCPHDRYEVNAFIPDDSWGYDSRVSFATGWPAVSTSGGGCMGKFHVDPSRDGEWLWGMIDPGDASSAIADAQGIPAFAICATAAACDPIVPREVPVAPPPGTEATSSAVSSVLFLPGIKGSELYEDNPLCLIPSDGCGMRLWLPLADAAVPELFLDANGKSKRSVFVRDGGVLESAFGQHFYDSFARMLDAAQADGTFGKGWDWKAVAYDWRLSLPDIVGNGAERGTRIYFGESTSTPYLEQTLRSLASSSPTDKVTIIAHSNGGLVAKELMRTLGDTLAAQLIDSVIFVGVPQSGAPRALGALLYGDEEGIPGIKGIPDVIMSAAHAREFGLRSPMAYHLLPSALYMSAKQPDHPLVSFDSSALLEKERAAYGPAIDTEAEMESFALAEDGDRAMPAAKDLSAANILDPGLLAYARDEHATLDAWEPPAGIRVYELGGYGISTISGIDLYSSTHADGSATLSYRPMFMSDGDGTVPLISALMMDASAHVHHVMLDLKGMSATTTYSHGNLFEAPDVQATIKDILLKEPSLPYTASTVALPSGDGSGAEFGFYAHSPVSLSVTDAAGDRTSVGEDGTEESIPGSEAGTFGEVKYVLVPADRAPYALTLASEGSGTFTLDLQELEDGIVTASSTIADVPVTPATRAALSIPGSLADASALSIDEDGSGQADISISPVLGATVFPPKHIETASAHGAAPHHADRAMRVPTIHPIAIARSLFRAPSASSPGAESVPSAHTVEPARAAGTVLGAATSAPAAQASDRGIRASEAKRGSFLSWLRSRAEAFARSIARLMRDALRTLTGRRAA